ncbi:intradiol ring-cleavage dioxygenase [Sphaerotilus sp.]|uniref:intradiol ring-cleavage dioxygenase n=1 Tax=Sphaerotilus sp. TaxID=2093942 RepID=UPI00286E6697|nr:intradiol ring-cleavage dioxygenase [Sphaerotilus sp.]
MAHHPHGLRHDLEQMELARIAQRRRALRMLGGMAAGALPLIGCGGGDTASAATTGTGTGTVSSCSAIPGETAGPFPGDGTNSNSSGVVNVLTQTGIVRSDIRSSFNGLSGTASGVPLTVTLRLVNTAAACADLAGYAVYLWHCTADGGYSLYSSGVTGQNFLRGVQVADANGQVTFTTIFPGCYSGRWPHIHFEVFPSLAVATSGSNDVHTSQLALPSSACTQVYGVASGYSASVSSFNAISLTSDNVFSDDAGVKQIATVTGNVTSGFAATLTVGV